MIPILVDHNPSRVIGLITDGGSRVTVEFEKAVSREDIFKIFGNCGFRGVPEVQGNTLVYSKIEILEWSYSHV